METIIKKNMNETMNETIDTIKTDDDITWSSWNENYDEKEEELLEWSSWNENYDNYDFFEKEKKEELPVLKMTPSSYASSDGTMYKYWCNKCGVKLSSFMAVCKCKKVKEEIKYPIIIDFNIVDNYPPISSPNETHNLK
jgi:hypothetical protein